MFGNKRKYETEERLDRLGRTALRMSVLDEEEAAQLASSPFLYARVRARIAAERTRREATGGWFAVARHAVPALALASMAACCLFWLAAGAGETPGRRFNLDAFFGAPDTGPDTGMDHVIFAERPPLSRDDALATLFGGEKLREGLK